MNLEYRKLEIQSLTAIELSKLNDTVNKCIQYYRFPKPKRSEIN